MPRAIQTIFGYYTAAAAGTGVATPAPGDTFQVPSFDLTAKARIAQVYASGADTDFVRIRSPRMHDANQGLRLFAGTTKSVKLLPWEMSEVLYPSDTPVVEIDETAVATGGILVQYDYDDLPGVQPRLASPADIAGRVAHLSGVEVDLTSGAIGTWGNGEAINSSYDNFEAGADYALLGYTVSAATAGIAVTGKDTGNLKIGGPGDPTGQRTSAFFVDMSDETGRPCIPIIAANNKGSTLVQSVDVAAATVVKVSLILAQLA